MVQGVKVLKRRRDVVFSQAVSSASLTMVLAICWFIAVDWFSDVILLNFKSALGRR